MTVALQSDNCFLAAFEEFDRRQRGEDPPWLRRIRQASIARFSESGFPTTHDEDWRFTNVSAVAKTAFRVADPNAAADADELAASLWDDASAGRIVLVNGAFSPALSRLDGVPPGVEVVSLAEALRRSPQRLEAHLARYAAYQDHAFAALNTAFVRDGACVWVQRGISSERPIHVVHVSVGDGEPIATHPRTLVVVEAQAQLRVVESFVGFGQAMRLTNAVTELVLGDAAVIDHYKLQREPDGAYHVGTVQLHQGRDANAHAHCLTFGGTLVRNNINAVLAGEGGTCVLNGLYVLQGYEHVDNHLRVDHAAPHCNSRENFRGILDDQSRGVFTGRIVVRKQAQKTDAKQSNLNLLLGAQAQVNTKPQLEILADDVKCTHGATVGQIDRDALFYLRSRGLSERTARSMLVYAFAGESLDLIRDEALRMHAHELLLTRLPEGRLLREALPR